MKRYAFSGALVCALLLIYEIADKHIKSSTSAHKFP